MANSYKTVFTTSLSSAQQKVYREAAPALLDLQTLRVPDRETLKTYLGDALFWISGQPEGIDAELLDAARRLKLILRLGRLTNDIDVEGAFARKIAVAAIPRPWAVSTAEHALMQILTLAKRSKIAEATVLDASNAWGQSRPEPAPNWSGHRPVETISGSTVGLLGYGEVGAELADRLQGWGCMLLYHQPSQLSRAAEDAAGLFYAQPETIIRRSDFLVNLLPNTPETVDTFNTNVFNSMKSSAYLVSVGGGGVVDEPALAHAILSAKLRGAALDTFSTEPIHAENPLLPLVRKGFNVLLTPHTAAVRTIPYNHSRDFDNIRRFLAREPLLFQVV